MRRPLRRLPRWTLVAAGLLSAASVNDTFAQTRNGVPRWLGDRQLNAIVPDVAGHGLAGAPGIVMVPDGAGGVFVAWDEAAYAQVFLQRFDGNGDPLWDPDGILVAGGPWPHMSPRMVPDGAGGVVVVWIDGRHDWCAPGFQGNCDIYAQRIDPNGVALWAPDGVPIAADLNSNRRYSEVPAVSDGSGGVIVAWDDARGTCCQAYAQRVTGSGTPAWTVNGIPVGPPPTVIIGPGDEPRLVADPAGGAYVVWLDQQRAGPPGQPPRAPMLTVKRLTSAGAFAWTGPVSVDEPVSYSCAVAPDGAGGLLVTWLRSGASASDGSRRVLAQRVSPSGAILWDSPGVSAAASWMFREAPDVVTDGAGGAILAWSEVPPDEAPGLDVTAQRITADGLRAWGENGVTVSAARNKQIGPRLVSDEAGGAVVLWVDARVSASFDPSTWVPNTDVYAQRVSAAGTLLWAPDGTPVFQQRGGQGELYGYVAERSGITAVPDGLGGAFAGVVDNGQYDRGLEDPPGPRDAVVQRINDQATSGPVVSGVDSVIEVGGTLTVHGGGFTPGSVVNLFVSAATGAVNVGPLLPSVRQVGTLSVPLPDSLPLGQGVATVQVVNKDEGYSASNTMTTFLQGAASAGVPSITGFYGSLAISSIDPSFAVAHQYGSIRLGDTTMIKGRGFDVAHGVAVDIFCACPGGKVGPFFIAGGAPDLFPTFINLHIPAAGPLSPAIGPASAVVSNRGADGTYARKSNAVAIAAGEEISLTGVTQVGTTITVTGTGFSAATVINFFNAQGGDVVNFGGLTPAGAPRIPLTLVSSHQFSFTVPVGAVAGPAFIEAINPPYVLSAASGAVPEGAFTLY